MSNITFVETIEDNGVILSREVRDAFLATDRASFVLPGMQQYAYGDRPLPIGHEQTISQPSMVAFMLSLLHVEAGQHVLDVGSGSGWTTSMLSYLVGETGSVIGVERIAELVKFGRQNLAKQRVPNAFILQSDDSSIGWEEAAPYDRILVSANAETLPDPLVDQLRNLGRMVIPIAGMLSTVDKHPDGSINIEDIAPVRFVPLV